MIFHYICHLLQHALEVILWDNGKSNVMSFDLFKIIMLKSKTLNPLLHYLCRNVT